MDAAYIYRHLLSDFTEIGHSHQGYEKIQDPYSLSCQPQVMGVCLQQIVIQQKPWLLKQIPLPINIQVCWLRH